MPVVTDSITDIDLIRSIDRCDACNAEARVRVLLNKTNLPLLFCGHHYSASAARLATVATVTHDRRTRGR